MLTWLVFCQAVTFSAAIWMAYRYHRDINRLLEALASTDQRLNSALSVARPFMVLISGAEVADHTIANIDQQSARNLHRAYHFARTGEIMNEEVE